MAISSDRRLVTFDSEAYFLPCGVEQTHRVDLQLTASGTPTFKIRINGRETANITYNSNASTLATTIQTSLNTTFGNGVWTATASGGLIRLTAAANNFYRVEVIQGGLTSARVIVNRQGSKLIQLSADVMSMKFGRKVKTTETAGLSEIEDYPEVVGTSGTFSLSMYGTVVGDWLIPMSTEGLSGIIYWFPNGRVVGNTYTAMRVLLDGFDEDLPFHEKVEVAITGTRQGAMIAPTGTILSSANIP